MNWFFSLIEKVIDRKQLDVIYELASIKAWEQESLTRKITYKTLVATTIISWNCILMFVVEVLIELALLFSLIPSVPFRLDFLSLTVLSTLLAIQAIRGVREGEIDLTGNALVVSAAVELFLLLGDIVYLLEFSESHPLVVVIRVPFMALTAINFGLVNFLAFHTHWVTATRLKRCNQNIRMSMIIALRKEVHDKAEKEDSSQTIEILPGTIVETDDVDRIQVDERVSDDGDDSEDHVET